MVSTPEHVGLLVSVVIEWDFVMCSCRCSSMDWLWSHLVPRSTDDSIVIYLAASVGFKVAVCWARGSRPPSTARCVGHVTAAKLYPVKSLGGLALDEAECTQTGLKAPGLQLFDR